MLFQGKNDFPNLINLTLLFFRYSHSADIIDDTLWLLGGMNANERRPPGLCKINLITGDAIEYPIPVIILIIKIILKSTFLF